MLAPLKPRYTREYFNSSVHMHHSMDILKKDCSTMVMGVWTVGVTYNCNISGSNQDIFTNEAPIDSGGFFALI